MRLLDEHPDDSQLAHMVVIVTSHTTSCTMRFQGNVGSGSYDDLALEPVVLTALKTLRSSDSPSDVVSHALTTVCVALEHATEQCSCIPGLVNLLVALTRSKSMFTRGLAIGPLDALFDHELGKVAKHNVNHEGQPDSDEVGKSDSSLDNHDSGQTEGDSSPLQADIPKDDRELPENIARILGSFDWSALERTIETRCDREFRDVCNKEIDRKGAANWDLLPIGRILATCVLTIGYPSPAYREGLEEQDKDLHYNLMSKCVDALRRRPKGRADLDAADVLELRIRTLHYCVCGHNRERELAQRVLARSPGLAYAHLSDAAPYAPSAAGRSAARRGLECAGVSRWLRGELLMRSVGHTFGIMRDVFPRGEGGEGGRARDLAGALVVSALRDVDAFIAEAPPDALFLQAALEYKLILMLILQGDAIDAQLVQVRARSISINLSL